MKKHFLLFAALCLPALVLLLLPEQAHAANEDFVSKLVHEFYNKTAAWEPTLKKYALVVFRWLVILEVCFLGIKAALNRDQLGDILKQFVMLLLMAILTCGTVRADSPAEAVARGNEAYRQGRFEEALKAYDDPVYLHQTKIRLPRGNIVSLPDLTPETLAAARQHTGCELRTHFHVPLFFEGDALLGSTHADLSPEFFAHARRQSYPLEIETYTFHVLPPAIRPASVVDCLVREQEWAQQRLG